MKKLFAWVLGVTLIMGIQMSCKKTKDTSVKAGPTLADTLRATCTSPFDGPGDSSHIWLPTAFTPNGDGLNDVYSPIGYYVASGYFSSLSVKVYDTTGILVYQSSDTKSISWDGTDQNTHSTAKKYKYYVKIKYTTAGNITDSGSTYVYLLSGTTCVNAVSSDTASYRFPSQFDLKSGYTPAWSSYESYCH